MLPLPLASPSPPQWVGWGGAVQCSLQCWGSLLPGVSEEPNAAGEAMAGGLQVRAQGALGGEHLGMRCAGPTNVICGACGRWLLKLSRLVIKEGALHIKLLCGAWLEVNGC